MYTERQLKYRLLTPSEQRMNVRVETDVGDGGGDVPFPSAAVAAAQSAVASARKDADAARAAAENVAATAAATAAAQEAWAGRRVHCQLSVAHSSPTHVFSK